MITQKYVNEISYQVIGCAIEVHKHLGPGLLEHVYQTCLIEELRLRNLHVGVQVEVPIIYKDKRLGEYLRLDLMVEDLIIVEIKAVEKIIPIFNAQLLSYLKLAGKPKGLLINFHTETIAHSLVALVNDLFSQLPRC